MSKVKKEKGSAMPKKLYLALIGKSSYEHSGRSLYAKKFGGYRFDQGNVVAISHPQDILYFYSKREQFPFLSMHAKIPKEYKKRHVVDRKIDLSTPAIQRLLKESQGKYAKIVEAEKAKAEAEKVEPVEDTVSE
jgi:hypothetical protein